MSIIMGPEFKHEKYGQIAILISDQPGKAGSEELMTFAVEIGLELRWVKFAWQWCEHFVLMKGMIPKARKSGANEVTQPEFREIRKARHEAMTRKQEIRPAMSWAQQQAEARGRA